MREKENVHQYDDIIDLPHHTSRTHARMPYGDRAAQFSPFAALTGYEGIIQETARRTEQFKALDENVKDMLDRKLGWIMAHLEEHPEVKITYFQPDDKKNGGAYKTCCGIVKKIDIYERLIWMSDGNSIPIDMVTEIGQEKTCTSAFCGWNE